MSSFFIERAPPDGDWHLMMCGPCQIGIDDIHGPPEDGKHNFPSAIAPNHKTAFAGRPGWKARVRYGTTLLEEFIWERIPTNPLDPDSDTVWGWKRTFVNQVPIERGDFGDMSWSMG